MRVYDLIIVGAGVSGAALATVMARAGESVLLLEETLLYQDRVRGEWIAPWGVAEAQRIGVYDALLAAGGRHIKRHITYDEARCPSEAEADSVSLSLLPNVPGPLSLGHPAHCQALFDEAVRAGVDARRGVWVIAIEAGATPRVEYEAEGQAHIARAPLIVGADGRQSLVRAALRAEIAAEAPHHWYGGLLVDGAEDWNEDIQAVGVEGDFSFQAFPQGGGRLRLYGGYPLSQKCRFSGADGAQRFLNALDMRSAPVNAALASARPAGPLRVFFNSGAAIDAITRPGALLIGDAAGWVDPTAGLGLSIAYRDVRMVSEILKGARRWDEAAFAPYVAERAERMGRLRFAVALQASLDMEFGEAAKARRADYHRRAAADRSLKAHAFATMIGPERLSPSVFTEAHRARVLAG